MSQIALNSTHDAVTDKALPVIAWISLMMFAWPVAVAVAIVDTDKCDTWVRSHYQYMLRTLWIGLVYGVLAAVPLFGLIGVYLSTTVIWYFCSATGILLSLAAVTWYIVRCVKGLIHLSRNEAIRYPKTWLI